MKRLLSVVLAVAALVLLPPVGALAQDVLALEIAKKATLTEGGQTVLVTVTVTCPAGSEVLEAFVYVVQDVNQNTSQFAGLPLVCDGVARMLTVRVLALDMPFHTGKARVSGYILLTSGVSISPTAQIKIRA